MDLIKLLEQKGIKFLNQASNALARQNISLASQTKATSLKLQSLFLGAET